MIRKLPIKVKPYEHQVKAFNFALKKLKLDCGENAVGSCALLMDMGLGKSLTSIAIIGYAFKKRRVNKVLIVCPTSIINVWISEFKKFADYDYSIEALTGTLMSKRKDKLQLLYHKDGVRIAVVNYEATWRMEQELNDGNWRMMIDSDDELADQEKIRDFFNEVPEPSKETEGE